MYSGQCLSPLVTVAVGANVSSLGDERLLKARVFASESLDADTALGQLFKLTHCRSLRMTKVDFIFILIDRID